MLSLQFSLVFMIEVHYKYLLMLGFKLSFQITFKVQMEKEKMKENETLSTELNRVRHLLYLNTMVCVCEVNSENKRAYKQKRVIEQQNVSSLL